jgi:HD-like signal output (HDOD) protein
MTPPLQLYQPRRPSGAAIHLLGWTHGDGDELAQLIEQDAALMLTVLRQVNATAAVQKQSVGTVKDAMRLLGDQAVHQMASLGVILRALEDLPSDRLLTLHVLRQSVQQASAAAELLGDSPAGRRVFTAGLLQDVGCLVLQANCPQTYTQTARLHGADLCRAEAQLHGQDHTLIGSEMAHRWGLPNEVVRAIAGHHDVEPAPGRGPVQDTLRQINSQSMGDLPAQPPTSATAGGSISRGPRVSNHARQTLALCRMAGG